MREAFAEVKGLLAGKTSMACMGDMLTLAAFSHAIPINNSLLGAFTTEREALKACHDQQPDLLYITEQLEQGYGINLALKVKNISPATSVLCFCTVKVKTLCEKQLRRMLIELFSFIRLVKVPMVIF
jgi:hypothetical protein